MTGDPRLGLLGGTFDPIHVGHLDAAEAARTVLGLDQVRLIPSGAPPHRPAGPSADPQQRLTMAQLAVHGRDHYEVASAEIDRQGPSYTADTLRELHAEGWAPAQLFFILGLDAFADIATWREFPDVLKGAQFVVITRPGATANHALEHLPAVRTRLRAPHAMRESVPTTAIIPVEAKTRNVSSSQVRQRLQHQQPIDELVPPPVARYIFEHHLYTAVGNLHDRERHN